MASVILSRRQRRRLLGYERPEIQGPWIIERLAALLQGPTTEVPIGDIRLGPSG